MRVLHQLLILSFFGLNAWCFLYPRFKEDIQNSEVAAAKAAADSARARSKLEEIVQALQGQALQNQAISERFVQEPASQGVRTSRRPTFDSSSKYTQRHSYSMLQAFSEAVGPAFKSTVEVVADEQRLCYGAVVDADGWVITKDSQLPPKGKLMCRIWTGEDYTAQVVSRNSTLDLALLRIERRGLIPVQWSDDVLPPRGSYLATTSIQNTPVAFGVVSAGLIKVGPRRVRMGVRLRDDAGAVIDKVFYGTGAAHAGLLSGDRIRAIDGQKLANQQEALDVLKACRAGQCVHLTIERGKDEVEAEVQMMDLSEDLIDETEMEVNGSISARSSGFDSVFLHDTVLRPDQCGGPLVNLDGRAVGLNIARAGRVSSYALPAAVVRAGVDQMLSSAKSNQVLTTK